MVSNLCSVLTKKQHGNYDVNMLFFNYYLNYLRDEIVDALADGTSKLTLKNDELREYYIEYVPIEIQNKYVDEHIHEYNKQKQILAQLQKNLIDDMAKITQEQ